MPEQPTPGTAPRQRPAGTTQPARRPVNVRKQESAGGRAPREKFEIDRIVMLRVGLIAIILAFLYVLVRLGVEVMGGGGKRQAAQIERVVNESVGAPKGAAGSKNAKAERESGPK